MNRISREMMLMEWAKTAAKRGTCGRLGVGAVIARDHRPISAGYVGAPPGQPHCDEANCDLSQPCTRTIHAEKNAIEFAHNNLIPLQGADMFCTDSPCLECAKWIAGYHLVRFYFERRYRDDAGIRHLLDNHVEVYQLLPNGMLNRIIYLND